MMNYWALATWNSYCLPIRNIPELQFEVEENLPVLRHDLSKIVSCDPILCANDNLVAASSHTVIIGSLGCSMLKIFKIFAHFLRGKISLY